MFCLSGRRPKVKPTKGWRRDILPDLLTQIMEIKMAKMAKVSIIVPIYKVEKYLDQCVMSLVKQTCQDIEIILVNDGSPDHCPAMCDQYLLRYPDIIKVIHQENQSQNVAWNNGLSIATGKWVCFVDSDDWVELDMVETMLSYAEKDDADIHAFSHHKEYQNASVYFGLPDTILTEDEKANIIYREKVITLEAWGKLFRRSFVEEHKFRFYPHHFQHEDSIFNVKAFHLAKKVCLHSKAFYHYRMVGSGYMLKWDLKKIDAYYLYINRYSEFVDQYFSGQVATRMKQRIMLEQLRYFDDLYSDPRSGFSRRELIRHLKENFYREPFLDAIKEYPLSELPVASAFGIWLLRHGFVGAWISTYKVFLKLIDLRKKTDVYQKFE